MRRRRSHAAIPLALAALWLAGCVPARLENAPLVANAANEERRSVEPAAPDRPAVLMTFSGGGSRAAALAASVLREMRLTTYKAADGAHALTDDVTLISSVSGGSVTAAWFGLWRAEKLDELRERFLAQDNMTTLELEAVNPITWMRLAFTGFTRIDALEALFDERLFHGAALGALNQPGKPLIILNATDMAGGESFAFTPRRFNDICSSYDQLPLSTAVAASAAFPIALSPVNLKIYSTGCPGKPPAAEWARIDLSNPYTPFVNLPQYREARYTNDLRRGPEPIFREIEYLHLLDGGVADNLGIGSLRSALIEPYDDAHTLRAINDGKIKTLVIIVINARSDPSNALYAMADAPGLVSVLNSVTSVPIDANTASSQVALAALLDELAKAAREASKGRFLGMAVYGITIDYDEIPADTEAHRHLRDAAKSVPTTWTLSKDQLATTEAVGAFLLRHDPCYQALVKALNATEPPGDNSGRIGPDACVTQKRL
jgi:NTE family protein